MGLGEPSRTSANAGNRDGGGASPFGTVKRFPLAAQPEIMRVAEEDDQFQDHMDFLQHLQDVLFLFSTRQLFHILQKESGSSTFSGDYIGRPPHFLLLLVTIIYYRMVMQTTNIYCLLFIYVSFGDFPTSSNEAEASSTEEIQSSSTSTPSISALSRLKAKIRDFWFYAVQRWPSVLPLAREILQLVIRINLMFFYFEGLYWHSLCVHWKTYEPTT